MKIPRPRVVYSHDLFEHKTKGNLWDRLRWQILDSGKGNFRRARIILLARDPRDTFCLALFANDQARLGHAESSSKKL